MNLVTSDLTRITNNPAYDYNPAWSPDGRQIAFVSDRDGGDEEIYLLDVDGGLTRLTDSPTVDRYPTWSSQKGSR